MGTKDSGANSDGSCAIRFSNTDELGSDQITKLHSYAVCFSSPQLLVELLQLAIQYELLSTFSAVV